MKRKIEDSESEDEYDEDNDFIEEEEEDVDYSSYIKDIFGYDKSK